MEVVGVPKRLRLTGKQAPRPMEVVGAPKRLRLTGKQAPRPAAMAMTATLVESAVPVQSDEWRQDLLMCESIGEENPGRRKKVYLVTLPHPCYAGDACVNDTTAALSHPGSFERQAVVDLFLDVFNGPVYADRGNQAQQRGPPSLTLEKLVVFRELHQPEGEDGTRHVHYHIALTASASFRFLPYKRALRVKYGLASHWSCSHNGYWSAVRYCFIPTVRKPQSELDSECVTWARIGEHPPLFQESQEPFDSSALRRRREHIVKAASGEGAAHQATATCAHKGATRQAGRQGGKLICGLAGWLVGLRLVGGLPGWLAG